MATTIHKMSCPYDCPSTCGLEAEIEDGRLIKVKNDKTHPVSKNGICRKMQHYEQDIYSADRLRTPLRRVGRKGEAKFEPISWDEAVREITDQFKAIIAKWGAEAILPCVYSGVMSDIQRNCGDAFFNRMGASELVKTLCSSAKGAGYDAVVGKTGCLEPTELNDSDLYLIWSCNMAATRLQTLVDLQKPVNRHKKKILIDVYPNPTAAYCDQVITIKAGTDGALALSMGIAVQNFPEGAIISMPLRAEGTGKPKAFLGGVLSGIVEPIGAILTIRAAGLIVPALPYLLSFAAGGKRFLVGGGMISGRARGGDPDVGTIFFAVGFSVMMMLDVALG